MVVVVAVVFGVGGDGGGDGGGGGRYDSVGGGDTGGGDGGGGGVYRDCGEGLHGANGVVARPVHTHALPFAKINGIRLVVTFCSRFPLQNAQGKRMRVSISAEFD